MNRQEFLMFPGAFERFRISAVASVQSVCVRSHRETAGTPAWLVSSVSAELAAFCLSEWPDPSEEDTLV